MKRPLAVLVVLIGLASVVGTQPAQAASLSAGIGTVDPEGVRRTPWFTVNLRWKLGKRFLIEPEAGYWKKTTRLTPSASSIVQDRNVGLNFVYPIRQKSFDFFVAAGVGLHLLEPSTDVHGTVTAGERELKQALHVFGGAEYKLGGLTLFGAVRFDTVADANQSKLYGGVRLGK